MLLDKDADTGSPVTIDAKVPIIGPLDPTPLKLPKPLRVALVDADAALHATMREQIRRLDQDWQLEVYATATLALTDILEALPQVVLMEAQLPDMSGVECTRQLMDRLPGLPVVMFTTRRDLGTVIRAMTRLGSFWQSYKRRVHMPLRARLPTRATHSLNRIPGSVPISSNVMVLG